MEKQHEITTQISLKNPYFESHLGCYLSFQPTSPVFKTDTAFFHSALPYTSQQIDTTTGKNRDYADNNENMAKELNSDWELPS